MAQKSVIAFTCYKIVNPNGSIPFGATTSATSAGATKTIILSLQGISAFFESVPARTGSTSTDDTKVTTGDGWQYWMTQESADVLTALSATDMTTS